MKPRRLQSATILSSVTSFIVAMLRARLARVLGRSAPERAHRASSADTPPMPIYEYRCENGHEFEVIQSMSDDPVTACEECGAPVERVFHPVAVHFKGSGFYTTDYAKKGKAASRRLEGRRTRARESDRVGVEELEGFGRKPASRSRTRSGREASLRRRAAAPCRTSPLRASRPARRSGRRRSAPRLRGGTRPRR